MFHSQYVTTLVVALCISISLFSQVSLAHSSHVRVLGAENVEREETAALSRTRSHPSSSSLLALEDRQEYVEAFPSPHRKNRLGRRLDDHAGHDHDDHGHEDEDEEKKSPWGEVLGATFLVNLATLSGVIFLIPFLDKRIESKQKAGSKLADIIIPAFAAGALIATVVFLTAPEAITLIQKSIMESEEEKEGEEGGDGHEDHGFELFPTAIWRFGASILGGFLFPVVLAALFPHVHTADLVVDDHSKDEEFNEEANQTKEDSLSTEGQGTTPVTKIVDRPLAISILLGDALHNFCDGVFIGVAFKLCDSSTAWTIMAVTFYHEVAQELADYFLLTRHAGMTKLRALFFNFLAGLSVVLGGILVLATDFTDMSLGVLLALASGVYLFIAACECLPRVTGIVSTSKERLILLMMFTLGAVPIGLTLLNHQHCEAGGHDDH